MAMIMLWRCDGQSLNWPGRVKVVNNKYHVTLESCLFADHAFHLLLILVEVLLHLTTFQLY